MRVNFNPPNTNRNNFKGVNFITHGNNSRGTLLAICDIASEGDNMVKLIDHGEGLSFDASSIQLALSCVSEELVKIIRESGKYITQTPNKLAEVREALTRLITEVTPELNRQETDPALLSSFQSLAMKGKPELVSNIDIVTANQYLGKFRNCSKNDQILVFKPEPISLEKGAIEEIMALPLEVEPQGLALVG